MERKVIDFKTGRWAPFIKTPIPGERVLLTAPPKYFPQTRPAAWIRTLIIRKTYYWLRLRRWCRTMKVGFK